MVEQVVYHIFPILKLTGKYPYLSHSAVLVQFFRIKFIFDGAKIQHERERQNPGDVFMEQVLRLCYFP